MARKGENIRKRTDGRWEGRYPAWNEEKGRNVSKSVYARTYAEVREKLAAAKMAQMQECSRTKSENYPSDAECIDYERIALAWLDDIKQHKKYSTYVKYSQVYGKHLRRIFSSLNTADISAEKIEKTLSGMDISSQSLSRSIYSVANQILKYAHDHYGMPQHRISPPKEHCGKKPVVVLAQAEQKRLLKELYAGLYEEDRHYQLGILLGLYTGLRLGDGYVIITLKPLEAAKHKGFREVWSYDFLQRSFRITGKGEKNFIRCSS